MKYNHRMNSNTKAKIALFSVLGVLAVANYQGHPQAHQSQGETEFASLGAHPESKDLEKRNPTELKVLDKEHRENRKTK